MKTILINIGVSAATAMLVIAAAFHFHHDQAEVASMQPETPLSVQLANLIPENFGSAAVDFRAAATITTPAVVHVRKTFTSRANASNPFRDLFGDDFNPFWQDQRQQGQKQMASGSGVILTQDGYIVTNNHVIDNADEIEVTLYDKRSYKATLVGADPSTDLAVLKIEQDNLPYIGWGNSDDIQPGDWVLAVGNPFDLTSTVTAGIVSAKGRNINVLSDKSKNPIESFIQTDAAVNPGNSGGALVNLKGELIGINTAIATPTGAYAGYAFAVPVSIVRKAVTDIIEFGMVQRAFLGVNIQDISSELAQKIGSDELDGVYVARIVEGSGAESGGLKEGDIITGVEGEHVGSVAELQEQVSLYRPGQSIKVSVLRNGKTKELDVLLKNRNNTTAILTREELDAMSILGVDMEALSSAEMAKYRVSGGVKIKQIGPGKISNNTSIREDFVITRIDQQPVKTVKDVEDILASKQEGDGVLLGGFYPDQPWKVRYYAFGL